MQRRVTTVMMVSEIIKKRDQAAETTDRISDAIALSKDAQAKISRLATLCAKLPENLTGEAGTLLEDLRNIVHELYKIEDAAQMHAFDYRNLLSQILESTRIAWPPVCGETKSEVE